MKFWILFVNIVVWLSDLRYGDKFDQLKKKMDASPWYQYSFWYIK